MYPRSTKSMIKIDIALR